MKSTEKVIDCLNDAFRRDPDAIRTLFTTWTFCNKALMKHPTVICGETGYAEHRGERWSVTALGVINGIMSTLDLPPVAAKYDIDEKTGKRTLIGFTTYNK